MPARSISRLLLLLLSCLLLPALGQAEDNNSLQLLHEPWNKLLRQHVTTDGRLNYAGLLADEEKLQDYLLSLRKVKPDPAAWTADETKAFWLNVYNAAATSLILDFYPITSINDVRIQTVDGPKSAWDAPLVNVGGHQYSLNQIEREMLRNPFHDPRVHFGLMYAAVSGAPVQAEAFDGQRVSEQLDTQTRRFLNDPAYNRLTSEHVWLSGLFMAYSAEFGPTFQLITFLNRYSRTPVLPTAQVEYLSFNWALNDRNTLSNSQALGRQ